MLSHRRAACTRAFLQRKASTPGEYPGSAVERGLADRRDGGETSISTLAVNTMPTSAKWLCEDLGWEVMAPVELMNDSPVWDRRRGKSPRTWFHLFGHESLVRDLMEKMIESSWAWLHLSGHEYLLRGLVGIWSKWKKDRVIMGMVSFVWARVSCHGADWNSKRKKKGKKLSHEGNGFLCLSLGGILLQGRWMLHLN